MSAEALHQEVEMKKETSADTDDAAERDIVNALFHMREENQPITLRAVARVAGRPVGHLSGLLERNYNLQFIFKTLHA